MKNIWKKDMEEYLLKIYKNRFLGETTEMINKKFYTNFSRQTVKNYLMRHHLRTGYRPTSNENCKLFSLDQENWIRENRFGYSTVEFTRLFNEHFHSNFTESQIKGWCNRHHVVSGLKGYFKKGCIPPNKGKKGVCAAGSEKGWFKKGHVPVNIKPIGTEVVTVDGYVQVKIAEPNVWMLKHRLVWEKYHGKIEPGFAILFLDGNRQNCDIDNLILISKNELATFNKKKVIQYGNKELNQAGINITRLQLKLAKLNKDGVLNERKDNEKA